MYCYLTSCLIFFFFKLNKWSISCCFSWKKCIIYLESVCIHVLSVFHKFNLTHLLLPTERVNFIFWWLFYINAVKVNWVAEFSRRTNKKKNLRPKDSVTTNSNFLIGWWVWQTTASQSEWRMHPVHGISVKKARKLLLFRVKSQRRLSREPVKLLKHLARIYLLIVIQVGRPWLREGSEYNYHSVFRQCLFRKKDQPTNPF